MRGSEAEAALQVDLARGGNEQVLPAYDVCDALVGIVGDDGKLVRPKSVGTQEDEVADVAGEVLGVMSDDTVVKSDGFVVDADAPCGRFVGVGAVFGAAAASVVNESVGTLGGGRLPVFAAAITGIEQAFFFQTTQGVPVQRMAAALPNDFAVPFETEGFERVQDMRGGTGHFARRVEIFHADQPFAPVCACIGVGCKRGQQRADVEQAGGAGGEASDVVCW